MHLDMTLNDLLNLIGAEEGITPANLNQALKQYFGGSRSEQEIKDYRISKGDNNKKLREEFVVVNKFFCNEGKTGGLLKFNLNSEYPDCWYEFGDKRVGIEVTTAMQRAANLTGKELNKNGVSFGFVPLQDDAKNCDELEVSRRSRQAYSTQFALGQMRCGIEKNLLKKSNKKYRGMILLVGAKLDQLKIAHWEEMAEGLADLAKSLPFGRVVLVDTVEGHCLELGQFQV